MQRLTSTLTEGAANVTDDIDARLQRLTSTFTEGATSATQEIDNRLQQLTVTLTEGAANAHAVARGEEIRDELSVMVGIANAVVERIMEAAEANRTPEAAAQEVETKAKRRGRAPRAAAQPAVEAC